MKAPNSLDITVEQLIELKTLNPSDFETLTGFEFEKIGITYDISEEEVFDMSIEDFNEKLKEVKRVNLDPKKYNREVGEFKFKEFKRMTLGEFIDLENYCSKDYIAKAPEIIALLYRKTKIGDWGGIVYEPLAEINLDERVEVIKNLKASEVFGSVNAYLLFREDFIGKRKKLFGIEDKDEEEDDEDEEEEDEDDEGEDEERNKLLERWSWHLFLYNLCDKDLTKLEAVTELNLFVAFNFASMKQQLKID